MTGLLQGRTLARPLRAGLAALGLVAGLISASPALADFPTAVINDPRNAWGVPGGGQLGLPRIAADGGAMTITRGSNLATFDRAWMTFCTPYGATSLVGMNASITRSGTAITGHRTLGIAGGAGDVGGPPGGAVSQQADNSGVTTAYNGGFAASPCAYAQVYASGNSPSASTTWGVSFASLTVRDDQGPSASLTSIPGGWVSAGSAAIGFTTSDNADNPASSATSYGVEIQGVSGASYGGPGGFPTFSTAGADGAYTVHAWRTASGWTDSNSYGTIYIDNNAPSAPSISGSSAWTNGNVGVNRSAASNDGTGSGVAYYQWSYDGGAWVDNGSSGYTVTAAGTHTLQHRAVDNVGRVSAASNMITVNIDRTIPQVSGLSSTLVAATPTSRRVAFSLSDTGGSGFGAGQSTTVQAFIGGTWTTVTSATLGSGGQTLVAATGALAQGRHDWRVTTQDVAGNSSGWITHTAQSDTSFIVDRTAPGATGNAIPLTYPQAEVKWTATDPNGGVGMAASGLPANVDIQAENTPGVWVSLHQGTYVDGVQHTANVNVSGLAPGPHDARVVVTDRLGQSAPRILVGTINNDNTPPGLSGITVVPHATDPTKVTLAFTADDGSQGVGVGQPNPNGAPVECNLGSGWTPVSNLNATPSPVVDGANTYSLDTSGCAQGVAGPGQGIRLAVSDKAGNQTQLVLLASAFSAYPTGVFIVDRTAPQLSGLSSVIPADGAGRAQFSFTPSDPAPSLGWQPSKTLQIQVQDTLSGGTWKTVGQLDADGAAISSHLVVPMTNITDGQLTSWRVVLPDRAGNIATVAGGPILIDRTSPGLSGVTPTIPGDPGTVGWSNGRVDISFTLADGGAGLSLNPAHTRLELLDGAAWTSVASGAAVTPGATALSGSTLSVTEGALQARVVTRDLHGNVVQHPIGTVMVDHTAPVLTLDGAWNLPGQRALIRWTSTDPGVGFSPSHAFTLEGRVGGAGTWTSLGTKLAGAGTHEADLDLTLLPPGSAELRVTGMDKAGRSRTDSVTVTVDTNPPTIGGPGGEDDPAVTYPNPTTARICWTLADAETGVSGNVKLTRDGVVLMVVPAVPGVTCVDIDLSGLPAGPYPILIEFQDGAGNTTIETVVVHVDGDAPILSGLGVSMANATSAAVSWNQTDTSSGMDPGASVVEIAPGDGTETATGAFTALWSGTLTPADGDQVVSAAMEGRAGSAWVLRVRAKDKRGNPQTSNQEALDLRPNKGVEPGNPALVPPGSTFILPPAQETMGLNRGSAILDPSVAGGVKFRVRYPRPGRVSVRARFVGPAQEPLAVQSLRVTEANIDRGTLRTDADGWVAYSYIPVATGELRITWPGYKDTVPVSTSWQVEVIPFFTARVPKSGKVGGTLVLRGQFLPGPKAFLPKGVVSPKASKAKKTTKKGAKKGAGGQPVALEMASPRVCAKLRGPMGLAGKPYSVKKLSKMAARLPKKCWVTSVVTSLQPNGKFSVTHPRLGAAPGAPAKFVYAQLVRAKTLPSTGWPFTATPTPARVVLVRG